MPGFGRKRGQNLLFERSIEQQNGQLALAIEQRLDEPPSQRLARGFNQRDDALIDRRGLQHGFENRAQVADRDPFAQQLFEHPADLAQSQQLGHQFLHQLWMALIKRVHQPLGLGPAQQLVGVPPDELSQMRGDDRNRVHD